MASNNNPESIAYFDVKDLLKIFAGFVVVLAFLFVFLLGRSIGAESVREDLSKFCRDGSVFTIERREGLFSCYRLDVEDK